MSIRIIIPYDVLYDLYVVKKMTKKNIAKTLGYSIDTIARNLKEYGIESHKPKDWMQNDAFEMTEEQRNILYGAMLGDGCLYKNKNALNAQFVYTSKSKQHVEFVSKYFKDMLYKEGIKYVTYHDKRTDKLYERYTFRTISNPTFQNEKDLWYSNGKKIIPDGFKINSTICLIWYIGDGAICNNKHSQYIQLSTDCFTYDEVIYLCDQLSEFEAKPMRQKDVYRIYIPHHKIKSFLTYIGECPFSDYSYKWNFKNYKNFSILNNPEKIQKIIDMFHDGLSAGTIAKHIHIDRSTVVKYLIQNGLDPKKNLYNKKKVGDVNEE